MDCQFEERQYESLLNRELGKDFPVFSPGQTLEGQIGIDAALRIENVIVWRIFGLPIREGVKLSPAFWNKTEKQINVDIFPRFKCNIFMQYKRPEKITARNGTERKLWKRDYFRYAIRQHQQKVLELLEKNTSANAVVFYACPAFIEASQLWDLAGSGELLKSSNLVRPRRLKGHHKYTFSSPGRKGLACSEPEHIEDDDFSETVLSRIRAEVPWERNSDFLHDTARSIELTVREIGDAESSFFADSIERLLGGDFHPLERSVVTISTFSSLFGVSWKLAFDDSGVR